MDPQDIGSITAGASAVILATGWAIRKIGEAISKSIATRAEARKTDAEAALKEAEAKRLAHEAAVTEARAARSLQDTVSIRYDKLEAKLAQVERERDAAELSLSEARIAMEQSIWAAGQHEERATALQLFIEERRIELPPHLRSPPPPLVPPPRGLKPISDLTPTIPAMPAVLPSDALRSDRDQRIVRRTSSSQRLPASTRREDPRVEKSERIDRVVVRRDDRIEEEPTPNISSDSRKDRKPK